MNERIKDLVVQAGFFPIELTQVGPSVEKFAQLIVRECAEVAFKTDVSYTETDAMHRIRDRIKQHFGVEE